MHTSLPGRINTLLLVLILITGIAIVALLAADTRAGEVDPPAPPGSTMQSLDDIPGSWGRRLDSTNGDSAGCGSDRFECVFFTAVCDPNCHFELQGVLDRETGLVWQRDPSANASTVWATAHVTCLNLLDGSRAGWRMASAAELMTLLDPLVVNPDVSLPPGHPFLNVGTGGGPTATYWSGTELPGDPTQAFNVAFRNLVAGLPGTLTWFGKALDARPWCVRGAVTQ